MALMQYVPPDPNSKHWWYPINAGQLTALYSPAEMLLYGGGSGGGKTDLLVADAAQEHDNPNLRALLIRRSFTEMNQLMDRCYAIYSQMGATYKGEDHTWRFPAGYPNGARVQLGYMKDNGDVTQYQGNPRTWLGVDESTFLLEKAVRDLLPWLATTDASLFPRVRLATNPGEIGADWHIKVFLRGRCPLHHPDESVKPGVVYRGARWPSDNVSIGLTVSFIPSLASDNPLYGDKKLAMLASQTAERRDRLLTGCWCQLSGRYFSFLNEQFKRPYAESGDRWWYTHIISIDYGYGGNNGGSWAAAGLYAITEPSPAFPEGRMYKVGEMIEPEMGSKDFARQICDRWAEPHLGEQRRRFAGVYFDPANDAHTGTGKSNMDLMMEVFERYDIPGLKAAKDRVGNAQNLYNMLKYGQVVICDSCPQTFTSLSTRMHDEKNPGDIKKIKGDPLDDYYDETAYAANTYFEQTVMPTEVANLERLKRMQEQGANDRTIAIEMQKMMTKQQKEDAPIYLGRHRRGPVVRR
jgi:hypothetical protein